MVATSKPILTQIRDYFEYPNTAAFTVDWRKMTDEDKKQLKAGFENGSMTY